MRILFLLPYIFIPPDKGNKNLIFNLLKYVTKHAKCDLVLLAEPNVDKEKILSKIRKEFNVAQVWFYDKPQGSKKNFARLRALFSGQHPSMGSYWNQSLAKWLQKEVKQHDYDLVNFDMIHMAQYKPFCKTIPSTLIASDAYSLASLLAGKYQSNILQKIKFTLVKILLSKVEKRYYPLFNTVYTVSKIDAKYLSKMIKGANLKTIGIAIGKDFIVQKPRLFDTRKEDINPKILSVGLISAGCVADGVLKFLRESYPIIQNALPKATTTVWGHHPTKALQKHLKSNRDIQHIDFVEDYIGFLENDWVYVYPQQCGTGFQTKVQQAMALGLPVVGFDIAFSGMVVENGTHCLICKTQEEFTKNVLRLLQDQTLRRKIGLAAAKIMRDKYSIDKVGKEMMIAYRKILSN